VFFEVKSLRDVELASHQSFVDTLWRNFSDSHYYLSIHVVFNGRNLPRVEQVTRYFIPRLNELQGTPASIEYSDSRGNSVRMDVLGPANGQGGPVSFSHGVR